MYGTLDSRHLALQELTPYPYAPSVASVRGGMGYAQYSQGMQAAKCVFRVAAEYPRIVSTSVEQTRHRLLMVATVAQGIHIFDTTHMRDALYASALSIPSPSLSTVDCQWYPVDSSMIGILDTDTLRMSFMRSRRVINTNLMQSRSRLRRQLAKCLSFSTPTSMGPLAAVGVHMQQSDQRGAVIIMDIAKTTIVKRIPYKSAVCGIAFNPGDDRLVSVKGHEDEDGACSVLDLRNDQFIPCKPNTTRAYNAEAATEDIDSVLDAAHVRGLVMSILEEDEFATAARERERERRTGNQGASIGGVSWLDPGCCLTWDRWGPVTGYSKYQTENAFCFGNSLGPYDVKGVLVRPREGVRRDQAVRQSVQVGSVATDRRTGLIAAVLDRDIVITSRHGRVTTLKGAAHPESHLCWHGDVATGPALLVTTWNIVSVLVPGCAPVGGVTRDQLEDMMEGGAEGGDAGGDNWW
ncbi:hypothetical protein KIPB_001012 [Kipferlia bialata]|uniref:Uncharacterized protein n=1 Tax=Kipferlia bialata TaxID=797122 RepID=A0A9K3CQ16_9EUKA|nr:hypothetical protein KIPB_001012 [Kipferlia bialata]|eukprot:g1012.t1